MVRFSLCIRSSVTLPSRITLPHLAVSSAMKRSNSAGLLPTGMVPIASSRAFTSGICTMAAISSAMRLTMGAGVPAGASMPAQVLAT